MTGSLTRKAASGARWLMLATVATTLISFGQNIALGRLLERNEIGLVGMLWAFLGLAQVFNDMGLSNAIIQRRDVDQKDLSAVYWVNLAAGCAVALLVYASGPLMTAFYHEPGLLPLVRWAAVSFAVLAIGQPFQAIAQKELRFARLAAADIGASVMGCAVTLVLAMRGYGAVSMVAGSVGSALARAAILIALVHRLFVPSLYWNLPRIRGLLHFGYFQMADKVMNFLGSNLDYLLVGRFLGSDAVGTYRMAYETAVRPLATINPIYNAIAYPIFSKQQDDAAALRRGLSEGLRLVVTIVFPMMAGLAMTASLVIPLMYGPKWAPAVPVLQVLCVLGAVRSVVNLAGSILLAKGLVQRSFWLNVLNVVLYAATYVWTVRMGLVPLAWSANILLVTIAICTWRWIYGTTIGLDWRQYVAVLAKPLAFSLIMAAIIDLAANPGWTAGRPAAELLWRVGTGVTVYGALLAIFDREYVRRLAGLFLRRD